MVGLCVSLSSSSDNADDMASPVPVILNKVITNELSDTSSLKGMDSEVRRYMAQWNLRGVSLSVMRNDSLLYAKGYGWADTEAGEEMQPNMIMRVASVSKLLTATGIMVLKERGLLSLQDTVFGPRGILTDTSYTSVIRDPAYRKITV